MLFQKLLQLLLMSYQRLLQYLLGTNALLVPPTISAEETDADRNIAARPLLVKYFDNFMTSSCSRNNYFFSETQRNQLFFPSLPVRQKSFLKPQFFRASTQRTGRSEIFGLVMPRFPYFVAGFSTPRIAIARFRNGDLPAAGSQAGDESCGLFSLERPLAVLARCLQRKPPHPAYRPPSPPEGEQAMAWTKGKFVAEVA